MLAPRAKAWDVSLAPGSLRLDLVAASAAPRLPLALTLTGQRSALSAALASVQSTPDVTLRPATSDADRKVRRELGRAGYALAVGLGLTAGGVSLAARTRPNDEFSSGVCTEDPEAERLFLGVGSGFMAVGLVISSATIVRLVLVPALMELMGKWNWYLPSWLQWLPVLRVDAEQHPTSAGAGAAAGGGGK